MQVTKIDNICLQSLHNHRYFGLDMHFLEDNKIKPIIIFIHGFKGFKDWGHFNLMANQFAENGFVFIKINLSHNGTTIENPAEIIDKEAFGQNNLTIELDDLGVVINHIHSKDFFIKRKECDTDRIYLIGHSRGGASAILKANEDKSIKAIITLAAVNNIPAPWKEEDIAKWKNDGVKWFFNSRTKENLPVYYQYWENYIKNNDRLNIPNATKNLKIPFLIIHGDKDESLPVSMAEELHLWNPDSKLEIIKEANHTFGGYHPFTEDKLPAHTEIVIEKSIDFLHGIK